MSVATPDARPARNETKIAFAIFACCLMFNLWGTRVGWESRNLPGVEFRQAQTAISAYHIQQNNDFSLAYPTPVLGKPWSVPMEFPLYQWTAVSLSNVTGLSLIKAGRLVSQVCFLLCLPAVFLLLGRMEVKPAHRWLVLAVVVTSPFFIFYGRAFLIETMALVFALWFWVAFENAVEKRSGWWLVLAALAGSGAGLVKVTTFILYLLPAGWWAVRRLWRGRSDGTWRGDLLLMALAAIGPFGLTLWWLHFSDAVKALNPSAGFLIEGNVRDVTLGTWASRFSPELWRLKRDIIMQQVSWWPLLVGGGLLVLASARKRAPDVMRLLLWFGAALVIFPVLYAWHEYYFVANGLLLLLALGLGLVGLAESGRPRWVVGVALLALVGGQMYRYGHGYYQAQRGISPGGDGLSESLRGLTGPGEILVITGQDWNSMTPYYAQRRALMIREDAEKNTAQLDAAFAALAREKIGALALGPDTHNREALLERAKAWGIDPEPLYRWRDVAVHLPLSRRRESILKIFETGYDGLVWAQNVESPFLQFKEAWFATQDIKPQPKLIFSTMQPQPVRFFATFGLNVDGSSGLPLFSMHPVTRLVFRLAPGRHTLRTTLQFQPAAYDAALSDDETTDGVELTLAALDEGESRMDIHQRQIDPRMQETDRSVQQIVIPFSLEKTTDVELAIGPGPQNSNTRDWVWMGPLVIE